MENPLRILGATAYPPITPSARVRVATYSPFLAKHGIELEYRPALTNEEYRALASSAPASGKALILARSGFRAVRHRNTEDLLLVHRLRLLSPLPGIDPPRALDIYDFDDALFLGSALPMNRRFGWVKQEAKRSITCMRRARLVIAGNSYLASNAQRYARRVEVVPSCVDPEKQPLHRHNSDGVPTVGWIGSATTAPYLELVLPILASLNRQRIIAKLVVVGADTRLGERWIEHRPWSLEEERNDLASFDIGLMPMPETNWARGKCGYKLLQYFAAGVPAIASPVGVARELIGHDRGLLASTAAEWESALISLLSDAHERRERGIAARRFAEREYSYQSWAPELAGLIKSLPH